MPLPQLPLDELPSWAKLLAVIIGGGAGARLLAVWLEHTRMKSKEYRETLYARIRELEEQVEVLQGDVADLRVENERLRGLLNRDAD